MFFGQFLTTGGIRGGSEKIDKFQPRSFNMGLSKAAFLATNGFGNIHPGEDPDLSIRLWDLGFKTRLITDAFVFHKRRIDWEKFYTQVHKFGIARPILDLWHPQYRKLVFSFPSFFAIGFIIAIVLCFFKFYFPIYLFLLYFLFVFLFATLTYRKFKIGIFSMIAVAIQFYGYGAGYVKSFFYLHIIKQNEQVAFPHLFFKNDEN